MKRMPPVLLALVLLPLSTWALPPLSDEEIALLHWLPETAEEAMIRTQAATQWLALSDSDPNNWRQQLDIRSLALARQLERFRPLNVTRADGLVGWLVQARDQDLGAPGTAAMLADSLLAAVDRPSSTLPVQLSVRGDAELRWRDLRARLSDQTDLDPALEISAFWAGLRALAGQTDEPSRQHAQDQVRRHRAMAETAGTERLLALAEIARAEAADRWRRGEDLAALWFTFEALLLIAPIAPSAEPAALLALLSGMIEAGESRWRALDEGFPVVLAQIQDAAEYLAEQPPAANAAVRQLADAYFRMVLFAPDAAFYLDQPVREHIGLAVSDCQVDPAMVGPLPRDIFDQCPARLIGLLNDGLGSEELVGGAGGPFAPEFLRREMSLVSWQRARYLDGHLAWQLQANCEAPAWVNPLEWSILVQYLTTWVPQRPVFFGAPRWQDSLDALAEQIEALAEAQTAWVDCMTGLGGQRHDPVSRLLRQQERALAELALRLDETYRDFLLQQTRPGSDLSLEASADQLTAYRPEGLLVRPCADSQTCGARAELPVSRALLGLFPNTYLLADQLGLGELGLCYAEVRWVDREQRPARPGDAQVANYHGRLSFELIGTFTQITEVETVFRHRLTAQDSRHYLFAAASEEILELDCPVGLAGQPVASQLPADRPGLVPNRLTYFASTPVTAEALLSANWERGAEWRDWFITGDRVEVVEQSRPEALQARVQAELETLSSRRERQISARLLGVNDEDPLSQAMAAVADLSGLLRRVLEIHYPRLLRHDPVLRAGFSGQRALLGREQIRQFRDAGRPMSELSVEGRTRLAGVAAYWEALPERLREQGQTVPEIDQAMAALRRLRQITPPVAEPVADPVESSPEP